MIEQNKADTCLKCNTELQGKFCTNCGQDRELKRINGQYILSEIGSVLKLDKGILFTIKELILRPGMNIRMFLHEDRTRLVKPIFFLIVTSLVYTLVQQWFHFEGGSVNTSETPSTAIIAVSQWVQNHYGYSNIIMAVFIGVWVKIFFRKHNYNYYEILVLLCFVMGIGMLFYTFFGLVEALTTIKVLQIGGLLGFVYVFWAIGSFFGNSKKMNYLKAFLSYMLGMITFSLAAVAVGLVIDWITK